jgi:hypothetical protein
VITNPDAQDRIRVDRRIFGEDVTRLARDLEQRAGLAREYLADPRLDDDFAAIKDYLLRACRAVGDVAAEAEQEA